MFILFINLVLFYINSPLLNLLLLTLLFFIIVFYRRSLSARVARLPVLVVADACLWPRLLGVVARTA